MENKFDFKLGQHMWMYKNDSKTIFHAELIGGEYLVTWEDFEDDEETPNNGNDGTTYKVEQAEDAIKIGDWIILNK